jgi:hypothetical protein
MNGQSPSDRVAVEFQAAFRSSDGPESSLGFPPIQRANAPQETNGSLAQLAMTAHYAFSLHHSARLQWSVVIEVAIRTENCWIGLHSADMAPP